MKNIEALLTLIFSELSIPTWQIVLCIGLVGFFMLMRKTKFCLLTSYLFTLYWIFYLFRPYLVTSAGGNFIALAAYVLFGLGLAGLALYASFSFTERERLPGLAGYEVRKLQKTLLKRLDKMEQAVLEVEKKTISELRQFEELKQKDKPKGELLEDQLQSLEQELSLREVVNEEIKEGFSSKIRVLESELKEKESQLRAREEEIRDLKSVAEAEADPLKNQLQEMELELGEKVSSFKETEEKLSAKIHHLENQLKEKEYALQTWGQENEALGSEMEANVVVLQTQLLEKEEALIKKASSCKESEEKLHAKIHGLEHELKEKE